MFLLLLLACDRVLPSVTTVNRGHWTLERHRVPTDRITTRLWCDLSLDGQPVQPFSTRIAACSLGHGPDPLGASFVMYDGVNDGLYVMSRTHTTPQRISAKPELSGFWSSDGAYYVTWGARIRLADGEVTPFANWPGWFLDLSPDGAQVLSVQGTQYDVTLYLTPAAGPPSQLAVLPRYDYGWILERTDAELGTDEGPHLSVARRIRWERDANSNWQIRL